MSDANYSLQDRLIMEAGIPTVKEIAARIQARRERLKLTQADMAARLNEPVGTYSRWDNGANAIAAVDLARIAQVLGVHVSYLFGEITEEQMADEATLRLFRQLPPSARAAARAVVETLANEASEGRLK